MSVVIRVHGRQSSQINGNSEANTMVLTKLSTVAYILASQLPLFACFWKLRNATAERTQGAARVVL